jgi:hypothetical protein
MSYFQRLNLNVRASIYLPFSSAQCHCASSNLDIVQLPMLSVRSSNYGSSNYGSSNGSINSGACRERCAVSPTVAVIITK